MPYGVGRRFRSREDKERARAKRYGPPERRTCEQCRSEFFLTYGHQQPHKRFCSVACQKKAITVRIRLKRRERSGWAEWQGERHCDRCGEAYSPKHRTQRFCTAACAQQHRVDKLRMQRSQQVEAVSYDNFTDRLQLKGVRSKRTT
jgi:hypothetical protein